MCACMKLPHMRNALSVLFLAAAIAFGAPAFAQQSPEFMSALSVFNAGQYPRAADMFVQYLRQQPNDALAHYYLGITWHCLGRASEAATEYSWVRANSADPELLKRAEVGLHVVARTGQQAPVLSPAQPPASTAPSNEPRAKIVDVYTQWCGWCKTFEPIFEQARAKYGNAVDFVRLDAEAPGNEQLVKKYRVRGFPTILLLDAQGKVRQRIDGAPRSLPQFEESIFVAYPSLRTY